MKPIYEEVTSLDKRAIEEYAIDEAILVENAARSILEQIKADFAKKDVIVVCGTGNNGADGLVLARLLMAYEFSVRVFMPELSVSDIGLKELETSKKLGVNFISTIKNAQADIVVDCLFGSGLNRDLQEDMQELIRQMNEIKAYKIACDIPSGIRKNGDFSSCFRADLTVTMGALKLALFVDGTKDFVGKLVVGNLGLPEKFYQTTTNIFLLEKSDLKLPTRTEQNTHKGLYGHFGVIMGTMQGAAIMAGMAAIKFGAGLVTIVSKETYQPPAVLMLSSKLPKQCKVIAIGMGIGDTYIEEEILEFVESRFCVIDADLFYSGLIAQILKAKKDLVLTPHPKEFASLLSLLGHHNVDTETVQKKRFWLAREFSLAFRDVVLVLKGSNTIIAQNGVIFVNNIGTPALSKAGSGDVLAGLIGALVAQGYEPLQACINAVLAHSIAACNYPKNNFSLTSIELIEEITKL